ncbi:MAG TPA: hypothetical protein PK867_22225 [Pirellulales bacterium]|nr:hypothetical protein [Pirellulales bacterium]
MPVVREAALGDNPTESSQGVWCERRATIEAVVAAVRSLWSAIEAGDGPGTASLKRDVSRTIGRLQRRVEDQLGKSVAAKSNRLLPFDYADRQNPDVGSAQVELPPRFPEPPLRVYAKDLVQHALRHLPRLVGCRTIDEIRDYLTSNLGFNSQTTRRRNANYLVSRFFPGETVNTDLPPFAAAAADTPALSEALFYLSARTEKIVALVAEHIVFPSLAQGSMSSSGISGKAAPSTPRPRPSASVGPSPARCATF